MSDEKRRKRVGCIVPNLHDGFLEHIADVGMVGITAGIDESKTTLTQKSSEHNSGIRDQKRVELYYSPITGLPLWKVCTKATGWYLSYLVCPIAMISTSPC